MKIHHVAISVRNLEKSSAFYKDNFGFSEFKRFEREDLGGKGVFLKLGEVLLEIWEFEGQVENKDDLSNLNILGIKHMAFEVDDVEEKSKQLASKNIDVSEPKMGASGSRYCFLKDPDGIPIELYEKQSGF